MAVHRMGDDMEIQEKNRFYTPKSERWSPSVISKLRKKIQWTVADTDKYIAEQAKALSQACSMLNASSELFKPVENPEENQSYYDLYYELDTLHQCLISAGIGCVARNGIDLTTCKKSLIALQKHPLLKGKGDGDTIGLVNVFNTIQASFDIENKKHQILLKKQIKNSINAISRMLKNIEKYRSKVKAKPKLTQQALSFFHPNKNNKKSEFDNASETKTASDFNSK